MGLVAASLKSDLNNLFSKFNPSAVPVGIEMAGYYEKYLMQGMNAGGGAVTAVAMTSTAGQQIGNTFQSYLPSVSVATNISNAFVSMASSIISIYQVSIVATPSPLLSNLIQIYSAYPSTSKEYSDKLGDALDAWTKTFIVSGIIPGSPPIPFTGPLS